MATPDASSGAPVHVPHDQNLGIAHCRSFLSHNGEIRAHIKSSAFCARKNVPSKD